MLKSGELRHTVSFLKETEIDGTYGKELVWSVFDTFRAKVTQPRTDENDSDHGSSRKQKLIIFMRYQACLSEDNRLIYNGVEYNITSCRDVKGTRRELIIDAEKRS